jgi:PKD repeat protein
MGEYGFQREIERQIRPNRGSNMRQSLMASLQSFFARTACALCVFVALASVGACDFNTSETGTSDVADQSDVGGDILDDSEPLPIPTFAIVPSANVLAGNAPLTVEFTAEVTGDVRTDEVTWSWDIGGSTTYDTLTFAHTFYVANSVIVTATATYTMADGNRVEETAELIVRVLGCADLRFDQVKLAQPVEVAPGDTVTFKDGALYNDGDAVESPFEVWVVLSKDDIYDVEEDQVVDVRVFDSIESGQFNEVKVDLADSTFQIPGDDPETDEVEPGLEDGNYYVFLVADPDETVTECQESNNRVQSTNNLTVEAGLALKPDLTASAVNYPAGLIVNLGQNINYGFTIANTGEGEAGQFKLAAYLSMDTVLDESDIVVSGPDELGSTVQQMMPGASQGFFKSYKIPEDLADGEYWIIVQADVKSQVTEDSEDNNIAVAPWPLTMFYEEPQCFDLSMENLVVTPLATYWGGSVSVQADITNTGAIPTPEGAKFRIYFSLEQTLNPGVSKTMKTVTLPSMAPGETMLVQEVVQVSNSLPVLPHYVGAMVDPDANLSECSESNNAGLYPTPVSISSSASVDLSVEDVSFHPSTVKAGQSIKVTSKIRNEGSSSATAFKLGVVFSTDPNFSYGQVNSGADLTVHTALVDGVGAGMEEGRVDKVTVPLELPNDQGEYYVAVFVDVEGAIAADNQKANNFASSEQILTVLEPMGGCFEDAHEPNDTANLSKAVEPGTYEGLGSCGDEDWFHVEVPVGHTLSATVTSTPILSLDPIQSDLDLQLRNSSNVVVSQSSSIGSVDVVHAFAVQETGTYDIRVHPKQAAYRASYELDVVVAPPVEGVDLMVTEIEALPSTLYPGGLMNVTWKDVNLGSQAAGSYAIELLASMDATADENDAVVGTYEADFSAPKSQTLRELEVLLPADLSGGLWHLLVRLDTEDAVDEANEDNNTGVSAAIYLDAQLTCADDDYEPNNVASIASELSLEGGSLSLQSMTVCPQLDDWYAIEIESGKTFSATVSYNHDDAKGLIAVELYDPEGETLLLKSSEQNISKVTLPWVWQEGVYFVRITNVQQGADGAPYNYNVAFAQTQASPANACDADVFEANNGFNQANLIGCGLQSATLCKGDIDVYRIELSANETLTSTMEHAESQLQMALYPDLNSNPMATKSGNGDLTYFASSDQTVYLMVSAKGDPMDLLSFDYTLFMDGVPGVDLTVGEPSLFFPGVYQGEDNLVDFEVHNTCVDSSEPFEATMWLSQDKWLDEADVDVAWIELPGIDGKQTLPVNHKVSVPFSTSPGDYYLLVEADSADAIAESNEGNNTSFTSMAVAKLCLPDMHEPNDVLLAEAPYAPALTLGETMEDLALCPFELDWFSVIVPPGKSLTVDLNFDSASGDLDLRLYDPTYSMSLPVKVAATQGAGESATYLPPVGGVVLVRVNGFDGGSAEYTLHATVE